MPKKALVETENKNCASCQIVKPLDMFHNSKTGWLGKQGSCKECQKLYLKVRKEKFPERYRELARNWKKSNPEKTKAIVRNSNLKRTYGIDSKQYQDMLEKQNYRCAICGTDTPRGQGRFAVDHCHKTNKVRELLCTTCNLGLGCFKDQPLLVIKALIYLNSHKEDEEKFSAG